MSRQRRRTYGIESGPGSVRRCDEIRGDPIVVEDELGFRDPKAANLARDRRQRRVGDVAPEERRHAAQDEGNPQRALALALDNAGAGDPAAGSIGSIADGDVCPSTKTMLLIHDSIIDRTYVRSQGP